MATRIAGGYAVVTVQQLANLCALKQAKRIGFPAVRVWLAAVEQHAKRCTAKGRIRFRLNELARLCGGLSERAVKQALTELEAEGILFWSEDSIQLPNRLLPEAKTIVSKIGTAAGRPVPLPRRILRLLAKHTKPAEVMAALAHLVRCLFKKGRELATQGFVRAEWVAEVFGVSIRAVYGARRWLTEIGVLTPLTVHQLVMNKHGALFAVTVERLVGRGQPLRKSAGPLKRSTRSCTSKNQILNNKPALRPAGVCGQRPGRPETGKSLAAVRLSNITTEDLRRISRLEKLYRQAVHARWLPHSEANARNFVAAAVRAGRVGGDTVRIFVGIVRKRLWHHITQEQETRAGVAMHCFSEKCPQAFRVIKELPKPNKPSGGGERSKALSEIVAETASRLGAVDNGAWRHYADPEYSAARAR